MKKPSIQKTALCQATSFWLGWVISAIILWAVINTSEGNPSNTIATIFTSAIYLQLIVALIFIISSAFLARALKKSAIVWVGITIFLGPFGFIQTYAMLSTTAKKLLHVGRTELM
jgi:hypothetical protein